MTPPYSTEFFVRMGQGSRDSAAAVVPLVMKLLQPRSVIDVGCGTGSWLAAFKQHGVADVLGIDGPYVDPAQLEIETCEFMAADVTQSIEVGREFDLAISVEVAEHLPESGADQFVEMLARLAPVILFSAAAPHQGGEHHINEQWPDYWVKRFSAKGFAALDPIRRLLWNRAGIDWWYAQNLLLFARPDQLATILAKLPEFERSEENAGILALVHPRNYLHQVWLRRVLQVSVDLATAIPVGNQLIVADEDRFGTLYLPGRRVLPFLERDKMYAGPPRDDEQAIAELHRMYKAGTRFIAFGWPAFWWFKHYRGFTAHLERHHRAILRNDRVVLFSLGHE